MTVDWDQLSLPVYEHERVRGEVWLDWTVGRYRWAFWACEGGIWSELDSGAARTDLAAFSQLQRCFGELSG